MAKITDELLVGSIMATIITPISQALIKFGTEYLPERVEDLVARFNAHMDVAEVTRNNATVNELANNFGLDELNCLFESAGLERCETIDMAYNQLIEQAVKYNLASDILLAIVLAINLSVCFACLKQINLKTACREELDEIFYDAVRGLEDYNSLDEDADPEERARIIRCIKRNIREADRAIKRYNDQSKALGKLSIALGIGIGAVSLTALIFGGLAFSLSVMVKTLLGLTTCLAAAQICIGGYLLTQDAFEDLVPQLIILKNKLNEIEATQT